MLRVLGSILVGLAALLVFLGFASAVHPAADSLSLLRPVAGALCLLSAVLCRGRVLRLCAALAAVLAVVTVAPTLFPGPSDGALRVYSKNLWFGNPNVQAVADDIIASGTDVVMLQEVSTTNDGILHLLSADYPHQYLCRFSNWSGIAVLSRFPIVEEGRCTDLRAAAAAKIMVEGQPLWIVSVHIHWPWPVDTVPNEEAADRLLRGLDAPVVAAGDFNIFAWSGRVRRVMDATNGTLAGPSLPTLTFLGIPLPIDHVIAPGGGHVTRRPLLGGDHRGIVADVRLVP